MSDSSTRTPVGAVAPHRPEPREAVGGNGPYQPGVVIIDLLPALPKAWPAGSVTGLRARGGFDVDLAWRDGKLTRVTLRSKLGHPCHLRIGIRTLALETQPGASYTFTGDLSEIPQ